jgi:flagellar biosynthesis protein FlhA
VRKSLGRAICARFADASGRMNVLSLDPHLEEEIRSSLEKVDGEMRINLAPNRLRQIIAGIGDQAQAAFRAGAETVILTDAQIRPYVRGILTRVFPDVPVVSYEEIAEGVQVSNAGVITPLERQFAAASPAAGKV